MHEAFTMYFWYIKKTGLFGGEECFNILEKKKKASYSQPFKTIRFNFSSAEQKPLTLNFTKSVEKEF